MSTALVAYERSSLAERAAYAKTLADAADLIPRGLFDKQTGRPSPAKILLVMETGAMLGLHPMAALQGIDVVEGKAAIAPRLMLGLIRGAKHKIRISEHGSIEGGDYKVTVTLIRSDDPDFPIEASFTPQMGARAGLCTYTRDEKTGVWATKARSKNGEPLPWEQYPEDLCLWRAVGRLGRRGAEDVLMGIGYIPEELGSRFDQDGEPVHGDPEPSEDWRGLIEAAGSKDEITEIVDRAKDAGEFSDEVRTLALTRYGMLGRDEDVVDAEVVESAGPEGSGEDVRPSGDRSDGPGEHTGSEHQPSSPARQDNEPTVAGKVDRVTGQPAAVYTPPEDLMTEEEYERISAEEHAAAVERGEVQS